MVFIAQILSSLGWTPGFLDYTQAFHSGDSIDRELYCTQPREGIPGAHPKQLIKLLKHCYGLIDGPHKWYEHLCKYLTKRGYVESQLDPCLFFLFKKLSDRGEHAISGILGIATDDVFHGGDAEHWANIEQVSKDHKLGKNQTKSGRFTGKDIALQPDGSIFIGQQSYVEDKFQAIPLEKKRRQQRFARCTSKEIEQMRGALGTLSWLSKETRSDLAGRVALLQQSFRHPRVKLKDFEAVNKVVHEAHEYKHLGILVKPIPIGNLRVGVLYKFT